MFCFFIYIYKDIDIKNVFYTKYHVEKIEWTVGTRTFVLVFSCAKFTEMPFLLAPVISLSLFCQAFREFSTLTATGTRGIQL